MASPTPKNPMKADRKKSEGKSRHKSLAQRNNTISISALEGLEAPTHLIQRCLLVLELFGFADGRLFDG